MATTYELIASTTLGTAAANIEFTSIPATYDDLCLLVTLRSDVTGGDGFDSFNMRFNGDNGSNYTYRRIRGDGSGVASATATQTAMTTGYYNLANSTSNCFGNGEIYIPNYAGSTNKPVSATTVAEQNSSTAYIAAIAGLWSNTSAITSILLRPQSGNFVTNSSAYLYGITKA